MPSLLERLRTYAPPSQQPHQIVTTSYTSAPVAVPESFLGPLEDPSQMKISTIDFASTVLPMYTGHYAVVIDGALSADECATLINLAEESAGGGGDAAWKPALVNAGANREILMPHYRHSDRIIWDQQEVAGRLWARIMQGEGMKEQFEVMEGQKYVNVLGISSVERHDRWKITENGLNERMRFLKYGAGQFFRPHNDGVYETPDGKQRSFYTLHLYLNDSAQEFEKEGVPHGKGLLRGGATRFHSYDETKGLDVDPKMGRVLIFQHKNLLHSGDDVVSGIKYTMRSDLMYERDY